MAKFIAFLDESGTPELEETSIDKNFPVFTLACCIFEYEYYLEKVNPIVDRFKYKYFKHRASILHSSDIRKRMGDFKILNNKEINDRFVEELNTIMSSLDYTVIASSIHKQRYLEK